MVDPGIVYVFKGWFSTECKIGKTRIGNLIQRERTVDKSNKSRIMRIAFFVIVFNTSKFEKRLHERYRKFRKYKPKSVSGSTEFFNLYIWQRFECYSLMLVEALIQWFVLILIFLFIYFWF